jgi:hypothetical protein
MLFRSPALAGLFDFWDWGHILCCGEGYLGFRPYGRSPFPNAGVPAQRKGNPKGFAPAYGPLAGARGYLRYGTDPGAAATVCFAAPPSAVYDCVVRSLRSHPRIDPFTQPAEGAKDQKPEQKQRQKPKPDQKIAAFGGSYSWIRCGHREIGRLSGRLREQARSHKSKSKAAQLPAAKPPHSTMSVSSSAFDLAFDPPATSEG